MAGKTCQICGKPSGMYPLCKKCFILKDEGKIVKDETSGKWQLVENEPITNNSSEKTCLLCSEPATNGMFCKSCYYKYKNKNLLLKIVGCKTIELLDDSYEGIYTCRDGHIVKSKSERDIDNYLYDKKIAHAYEKKLYYLDENQQKQELTPDFYLPDKDIYIEHWGYDETNKKYTDIKKFKLDIYKRQNLTIINTYEKTDAQNIDATLDFKLSNYTKNTINFLDD